MAPSSVSCPLRFETTRLIPLSKPNTALKCRTLRPERRRTWFRTRAQDLERYEDPMEVQDIDREYCNDFVCTSSPAVEETIKAFAVDLQRPGKWTLSRFPEDVIYKDPFRSFKGRQGYERLDWISESVQRPRVKVLKLSMLERDRAQVDWTLTGSLLNQPVRVAFQSMIRLNLLSGRIMEHRDEWDLKECSLLGALAFNLSRSFWSIQQIQQDTSDGLRKIGEEMGSVDEDESPYIMDPRDPYTFYERGDVFTKDVLAFLTLVAVFYLMYRGYLFVFQLK